MDREEMIKNMMNRPPLGPDDKFRFHCTACGDCCYDPEGIILSAGDIYRGAKFLGMKAGSFVEQYCRMYVGPQSRLPLLTVKTEGPRKKCIFLDGRGKCRIHPAKPSVCEVFPLGRTMDVRSPGSVEYRLSPVSCGKRCREHTVREWLSGTGLEKSNELFSAWTSGIGELVDRTKKLYDLAGDMLVALVAPDVAEILYCDYDTEEEFLPQFRENIRRLTVLLDRIEDFVRKEKAKQGRTEKTEGTDNG